MSASLAALPRARRPAGFTAGLLGLAPFLLLVLLWWLVPRAMHVPAYLLPNPWDVVSRMWELARNGDLLRATLASLERLAGAFVIGNLVAIPLGILIATNRRASRILMPPIVFFQSIAGIAWAPLAVVWFGIGGGAVTFLVVNSVFFSSVYNAVLGVQSIPPVLSRAVRSLGARRRQVLTEVILPGALVQILIGLRTSLALGWRALVAAELIVGTNGIGYMMMDATQWYGTDTVLCGIIVIGVLWLLADRLMFRTLERATVRRWGLLQDI